MPRLAPFLLASAVLHMGLLVGSAHRLHIAAGDRIEVISAYLDTDGRDTQAPSAHIASRAIRQAGSLPESSTATAAAPADTFETLADKTQPADTSTTPPTISATDHPAATAAATARVRALVVADLARHFYYPAIARARGWEGEVLLAFRVEQDGYLQATRIAQSSGHVALDQAALHSLRRIERIAADYDRRPGRGLDMQIPVIYRLTDTYY